MMIFYLTASLVVILFFAILWTTDEFYDVIMKVFLIILSVIGFVLLFTELGFLTQIAL